MRPGQRKGVVLILLGLALLMVAVPFAGMDVDPRIAFTPQDRPPTMLDRIQHSRIRLVQGKGTEESACQESPEDRVERWMLEIDIKTRTELLGRPLSEAELESRKQEVAGLLRKVEECKERHRRDSRPVRTVDLPYRTVFAVGVITLLVGVGMVILGHSRAGNVSIS